MRKSNYYSAMCNILKTGSLALLLCSGLLVLNPAAADQPQEVLSGFYARDGNNGSPSKTSGNNIYIKFFDDRWIGVMFIPFPYAQQVGDALIGRVFTTARKQASSAAYMRGTYGLLDKAATLQIERYGYLEDRIIFECGALSPCTIRLGDGYLELIKPGVINEHIIKYNHVRVD